MLSQWETRPTEKGTNAIETVTFVADWDSGYLSPLLFSLAVLQPMGTPETLRPKLKLMKTAQFFADAREYP